MELQEFDFDLRGLQREIGQMVAPRCLEKKLEWRCRGLESGTHAVRADELKLRQVLLNLLANAIKFTERGYVQMEIEAVTQLEDGMRRYRFVISDSGIGVPVEERGALFRRYGQTAAGTQR